MEQIQVFNPANEEVIGEVPRGTVEDVDRAVRSAREAFFKWRWIPAIEKAAMLACVPQRQHGSLRAFEERHTDHGQRGDDLVEVFEPVVTKRGVNRAADPKPKARKGQPTRPIPGKL